LKRGDFAAALGPAAEGIQVHLVMGDYRTSMTRPHRDDLFFIDDAQQFVGRERNQRVC
jgi:hypothetical protein